MTSPPPPASESGASAPDALPTDDALALPKEFDSAAVEERARALWEESGIYRFDPNGEGPVFSVDTPPPYVSAAHLHVGHAMSYSQAEFIIRYHRMNGARVFYPMGFDDNGLPTERYVETTYKINKKKTTRSDFRALCLEETRKGGAEYENLWRALGLSVDWRTRYSTIDEHCRRTAQKSFLDLYSKGRVYRSDEPVLWDPHFETAQAQADLETLTRKSKLNDIAFHAPDGTPLVISTTRPELIPACVALYCHPEDDRYRHLHGGEALVPLSAGEDGVARRVPIKCDEEVLKDFGTGLMMVCTFGDSEDVRRWKRDGLDTRVILGHDGRMNELAGPYKGLNCDEARARVLKDLEAAGQFLKATPVDQTVSVSERSGAPVEFQMVPQWFIRVLDMKDELLRRSAELNWHPAWMKERLDQWIEGLKYDWNISRQRFYGVPFPVWHCEGCAAVVLARVEDLPVDPLEDKPPVAACPKCGGALVGEPDVMDTWMTSSLTPLINANWAGEGRPDLAARLGDMRIHPMTVRVQAFEIIRTWLFYTVVKSHLHVDSLPWRDVMISGWGLNEQGKKISKRDLEKHTDASGYNRYDPYAVIRVYGADALRHWAAGSHLGHDSRFNEKDLKAGKKLVTKLWNSARFCLMNLTGFDPAAPRPAPAARTFEDRWLLAELHSILPRVKKGFEEYDYAVAREAIDRFFWSVFCDDWLEMVKYRFWRPELYTEAQRDSARATMWEAMRTLLGLYAPFLPFVTEELYQRIFKESEGAVSIHATRWPAYDEALATAELPEMKTLLALLASMRGLRTKRQIGQTRGLDLLTVDVSGADEATAARVRGMESSLLAVARVNRVAWGSAENESEVAGVRFELAAEATD